MTVEEAIRERIETLSPVVALVGDRVYLDKAPQSTAFPVVVVQLIDDPGAYHLRGPQNPRRARIQVDVYATETATNGGDAYADAAAVADAIHGDGLGPGASGIAGWFGSAGSPALDIQGCFCIDRTRGYEAEDMREVRIRQDFYVDFRSQA